MRYRAAIILIRMVIQKRATKRVTKIVTKQDFQGLQWKASENAAQFYIIRNINLLKGYNRGYSRMIFFAFHILWLLGYPKRIKNRTTGKPASAGQVARHRAEQSRNSRAVAGAIFCIVAVRSALRPDAKRGTSCGR